MKAALAAAALALFALAGCDEKSTAAAPPPPRALTAEAIGHYCGMAVLEHPGPKGQIILASREEPIWFSSARDAIAFTMLPEEAKDIRAVYVSDMGRASSWEAPGAANWVEARSSVFVIGSRMRGGMGADETVPFSDSAAAERFVEAHGGQVVSFKEVPRDYVLGTSWESEPAAAGNDAASEAGSHRH